MTDDDGGPHPVPGDAHDGSTDAEAVTDGGAGHGNARDPNTIRDEVASLAQRAIGRAIDLLIVATFSMAILVPAVGVEDDVVNVPRWTQVAALALWLLYEAGSVATLGTTVGKMAVGCRLADRATGSRPTLVRSLVRAAPVPGLLPLVSFVAFVVWATVLVDPAERRGVHDRIAGTVVVRGPGRERPGRPRR